MDNPEEKPQHVISFSDIGDIADKMFEDGKISNMEAAQLKLWATARPDGNAGRAKWESWKKSQPVDIPGLWPTPDS